MCLFLFQSFSQKEVKHKPMPDKYDKSSLLHALYLKKISSTPANIRPLQSDPYCKREALNALKVDCTTHEPR